MKTRRNGRVRCGVAAALLIDGWQEVADCALDWAVAHATGTAAGHHAKAPAPEGPSDTGSA